MKRSKKTILSLTSIALFSMAGVSGCGQNPAQSKAAGDPVVHIGYVKILGEAPAIIGKDEGIFKKDGINAQFYAFANGPDLYKAMASQQIDIGYAGIPQAVAWGSRGMQIKVIANVESGQFGLVTKSNAPEKTVADFRGKTIATVGPGSGNDILLRGFLLPEAHLTQKDVNIRVVPQQNMEAAIASGNVAAAMMGEPFLTFAELRNDKVLQTTPDPGLVVIATNNFLQSHPNLVNKFVQGHKDAIRFLKNHPQQANEDLAKEFNIAAIHTGTRNYTPEQVIAEARKDMHFTADFSPSDLNLYQKLADAVYRIGDIQKPFTVSSIIDSKYVQGN
ncbi:ABC transporter substrate-binding protein [Alicyclobacillus tolerans]|uniref:ABC transporter substrate-binding protein n=1 Tax=Alicyclobacillus tolerans TaxID=90970 RepID=UPI001F463B28|nr:ABC transporter substrate-binding protein [Alicyclobacillus tolerans]MCF8567291.1 ABC transporter substrate-binding protein [Alicyclobacillus tolerans]